MKKTLFHLATIAAFCACVIAISSVSSFAAIDKNAKVLADLDDAWSKAAASHNVDAVASYYADDAVVYPPNEPAVTGRAAAKEAWAKMLADKNVTTSWKTTSAGLDGNTGYTSGTYEVTDASSKVVEKGKYLCVWRKGADGKWKAIHDMWNSDSK